MKRLLCNCPFNCRFCGARRSRDVVGHYCKTRNCQWQHGYSTCAADAPRSTEGQGTTPAAEMSKYDRRLHYGPHDSQVARGCSARTLCGVPTFATRRRKQPFIMWQNGWENVNCKKCLALRGLTKQEELIEATEAIQL